MADGHQVQGRPVSVQTPHAGFGKNGAYGNPQSFRNTKKNNNGMSSIEHGKPLSDSLPSTRTLHAVINPDASSGAQAGVAFSATANHIIADRLAQIQQEHTLTNEERFADGLLTEPALHVEKAFRQQRNDGIPLAPIAERQNHSVGNLLPSFQPAYNDDVEAKTASGADGLVGSAEEHSDPSGAGNSIEHQMKEHEEITTYTANNVETIMSSLSEAVPRSLRQISLNPAVFSQQPTKSANRPSSETASASTTVSLATSISSYTRPEGASVSISEPRQYQSSDLNQSSPGLTSINPNSGTPPPFSSQAIENPDTCIKTVRKQSDLTRAGSSDNQQIKRDKSVEDITPAKIRALLNKFQTFTDGLDSASFEPRPDPPDMQLVSPVVSQISLVESSKSAKSTFEVSKDTQSKPFNHQPSSQTSLAASSIHDKSFRGRNSPYPSIQFVLEPVKSFSERLSESLEFPVKTEIQNESGRLTGDGAQARASLDEIKELEKQIDEYRGLYIDAQKDGRDDPRLIEKIKNAETKLKARKLIVQRRVIGMAKRIGLAASDDIESRTIKDLDEIVELAKARAKHIAIQNWLRDWYANWFGAERKTVSDRFKLRVSALLVLVFLLFLSRSMRVATNDFALSSTRPVALQRTSLAQARKIEVDLLLKVQDDARRAWYERGVLAVHHPCIAFFQEQNTDLDELYGEEKAMLLYVHKSLSPSIRETVTESQPSLRQIVELKEQIALTSQRFANIDQWISQHIYQQREGWGTCLDVSSSSLLKLVRQPKNLIPFGSFQKWLPSLLPAWISRLQFPRLPSRMSNPLLLCPSSTQWLKLSYITNLAPSSASNIASKPAAAPKKAQRSHHATIYDEYFTAIERKLQRSQRGHRQFRYKIDKISADISYLAQEWLAENQTRVVRRAERFNRAILEAVSWL